MNLQCQIMSLCTYTNYKHFLLWTNTFGLYVCVDAVRWAYANRLRGDPARTSISSGSFDDSEVRLFPICLESGCTTLLNAGHEKAETHDPRFRYFMLPSHATRVVEVRSPTGNLNYSNVDCTCPVCTRFRPLQHDFCGSTSADFHQPERVSD